MKITLDSFLTVIKRSGLITADRLKSLIDEFHAESGDSSEGKPFADFLVERGYLTAWQAEKLLQGKHKGFFLGKYRLMSLLGKGGMSSVFLAEHVLMRRRCAIKVLPAKRVNDTSYLGRFHREAQAVASLDHPNIVRAYDVDHETDGGIEIHFLVMEYVDGQSLLEMVSRSGPLDPVSAADYIRQAAHGLEHAHQAGLIHRDIKPGNLLVDRHGVVKVMDLGLARFFSSDDEASLTLQYDEKVLGTADYLAPEQAVDSHDLDGRADIYSLGCTLYFLLTGHPPFPQGTLPQRLMAHQTKEPTPVEAERKDVPESLLKILRKMMSKKVEDRHQSAAEVARELTTWLQENGGEQWQQIQMNLPDSVVEAGLARGPRESDGPEGGEPAPPAIAAEPPADDPLGHFLSGLAEQDRGDSVTPVAGVKKGSSIKRGSSVKLSAVPEEPGSTVDIVHPEQRGAGGTPAAPSRNRSRQPAAEAQPVSIAVSDGPSGVLEAEPVVEAEPIAEALPSGGGPPPGLRSRTKKPIPKGVKIGAAGGAIVLVLLVAMMIWMGGDDTPEPAGGGTGTGETVAQTTQQSTGTARREPANPSNVTVGASGDFATITEALEWMKQHIPIELTEPRVIRVAGGTVYPERIEVTDWLFGTLQIISEGDAPAVLRPEGADPVLTISSERVEVTGFRVDATGKAVAVAIHGFLSQSKLADLELVGFTQAGISGERVSGISGRRVEIQNLIFKPGGASAVGIRLREGDLNLINIIGCRMLGPMAVAIQLSGNLHDVRIERCRIAEVKTALQLSGENWTWGNFEFNNNTVHRAGTLLAIERVPASVGQVTIRKNLVTGLGGAAVQLPAGESAILNSLGEGNRIAFNGTDGGADASPLGLFARQGKTGLSGVNYASLELQSNDFLKPSGGDLKLPGAPQPNPYLGALEP